MLIKIYAKPREDEARYSPAEGVDDVPKPILGDPDKEKICTSHVEGQNLTIKIACVRNVRQHERARGKKIQHQRASGFVRSSVVQRWRSQLPQSTLRIFLEKFVLICLTA